MTQRPPEKSPHTPSRLGRGLGNLIPVPVQRVVAAPVSGDTPLPARSQSATDASASMVANAPMSAAAGAARTAPGSSHAAPVRALVAGAPSAHADATPRGGIEFVPLGALRAGRYQPRGRMDPAALEALATSIATSGLMQPIVVRPLAGEPVAYEVIAGERRWRALERLGMAEAPVIVRAVGDQEAAELSLVENLQREDLNPMDRAGALQRLVQEFGLTHQQVAARVGLDRASVTNLLRLNDLDSETAGHVRDGTLSAGHAKILVGVPDVARRRGLAAQALNGGWSVRQLEREVQQAPDVPRGTSPARHKASSTSAHVARLERELQEHLGTRVTLRLTRKKGVGELRIQFFSLDEFDGLMQRIGFAPGESSLRV